MKIYIPYEPLNWNEYINKERTSYYLANKIKQNDKKVVKYFAKEKYKGNYPIEITFKANFKTKQRDLDNYRIKGLIDGLVACEVIKGDNLNCIQKITLLPNFSKEEGVEIEIKEM